MSESKWKTLLAVAGISMQARSAGGNPVLFDGGIDAAERHWICLFSDEKGHGVEVPFSQSEDFGPAAPDPVFVMECVEEDLVVRLAADSLAGYAKAIGVSLAALDQDKVAKLAFTYARTAEIADQLLALFGPGFIAVNRPRAFAGI